MIVECPQCKTTLDIPEQYDGVKGHCTKCGGEMTVTVTADVPGQEPPPPPPIAPVSLKPAMKNNTVVGIVICSLAAIFFLALCAFMSEGTNGQDSNAGQKNTSTTGSKELDTYLAYFLRFTRDTMYSDHIYDISGGFHFDDLISSVSAKYDQKVVLLTVVVKEQWQALPYKTRFQLATHITKEWAQFCVPFLEDNPPLTSIIDLNGTEIGGSHLNGIGHEPGTYWFMRQDVWVQEK